MADKPNWLSDFKGTRSRLCACVTFSGVMADLETTALSALSLSDEDNEVRRSSASENRVDALRFF